jgi:hypothetical protein
LAAIFSALTLDWFLSALFSWQQAAPLECMSNMCTKSQILPAFPAWACENSYLVRGGNIALTATRLLEQSALTECPESNR